MHKRYIHGVQTVETQGHPQAFWLADESKHIHLDRIGIVL